MSLFKVRYKGLSDERIMTAKQLAERGVGVDNTLRWARAYGNLGAHNVVFIEDPSDELLQIFKDEGTFTVSEVKDDEDKPGEHDPIITGSVLDDTGSVVRDLTTGAESVKPEDKGENPAVPSGTEAGGTGTAGATGGTGTTRARGGRTTR